MPKPADCNSIPPWDKKIPDLCPSNIYVPPENHHFFQNFMSEELEKIQSNLELFIQNKKQFVQKLFYDIGQQKNAVYREKQITFIVGCQSLQASKLDKDFYDSLNVVQKSNGGLQGYEMLRQRVNNEKSDVQGLLGSIDSKIVQTKKEDDDFVMQLKQQHVSGAEYVRFEACNGDLIQNIIGNIFYIF